MKLEEKIMLLRKKNGWSQEELAFRLDVSRQAVSKWEMGDSIPDIDKIIKMSEVFGVTTDYLLKNDAQEATEKTEISTYPKTSEKDEKKEKSPRHVCDEEADDDEDDEDDEEDFEEKESKCKVEISRKKGKEAIFDSLFSCVILAIYLGVSFWTERWDITWIIWLLYGPVGSILRAVFSREKEKTIPPEKSKKIKKILQIYEEIYWTLVVAIYLGVSFLTKRWDITWLIWIIAIFIDALCSSILGEAIAKKEEQQDNENE